VRVPPGGKGEAQEGVVRGGLDENDDDGEVERRKQKHRLHPEL